VEGVSGRIVCPADVGRAGDLSEIHRAQDTPTAPSHEAWLCIGRRGGKSFILATIAVFLACFKDWRPFLGPGIESTTRESVLLKNSIIIEVHTASYRSTRGYTVVAALLDEIAYWPTDESSAEPDSEVLNAIKPAMATIPGAILLCASSAYARRGALWDAHRKHFGKDGPVLVGRLRHAT
jgi:phage terminase large subunit-like protein